MSTKKSANTFGRWCLSVISQFDTRPVFKKKYKIPTAEEKDPVVIANQIPALRSECGINLRYRMTIISNEEVNGLKIFVRTNAICVSV